MNRFSIGAAGAILLAGAIGGAVLARSQQRAGDLSPAAEAYAGAIERTQDFVTRRAAGLLAAALLQGRGPRDVAAAVSADAQRLGVNGPSNAELMALDGEVLRNGEALLAAAEARVRSGSARWPADKPAPVYANAALIMIASVRAELRRAVGTRADPLPALRRADAIVALTYGTAAPLPPASDHFAMRDAIVNDALSRITLPPPRRAGAAARNPVPAPAPATVGITYSLPRINGIEVDWCARFSQGCGQEGADQFCRSQGYARSIRWRWEFTNRTWVIGSQGYCTNPGKCGGLRDVTCVRG